MLAVEILGNMEMHKRKDLSLIILKPKKKAVINILTYILLEILLLQSINFCFYFSMNQINMSYI